MEDNQCIHRDFCAKQMKDFGKNISCHNPSYYVDVLIRKCDFLTKVDKKNVERTEA